MKLYLNRKMFMLFLSMMIMGMMAFEGCQVNHLLDPYQYGRVYMYQALNNPVKVSATINFDTTETIVYGAAYGGPKRADGNDISVSFSVNSSLVDSFNVVNLTSYHILPENCYTLSEKKATIPADKKSTPPFQLTIKGKVNIPEGQYLLPITVKVNGSGIKVNDKEIQVNKDLQTAYFLINVHK